MKSLWQGPQKQGITYSMIAAFLACRHRFWLKYVMGLSMQEEFNHAMEYGNLWHHAEETHGNGGDWKKAIKQHTQHLLETYPGLEAKINMWSMIALMQFEIYLSLPIAKEKKKRKYLVNEHEFRIRYEFEGRHVTLRGKIDRIFEAKKALHIEDHKTKGQVNERGIQGALHHDAQTMIYHVVSRNLGLDPKCPKNLMKIRPKGTYYNVIRRPLGDRFSIKQKKHETTKAFVARLGDVIRSKPKYFFMEFPVLIHDNDVSKFQNEVLHPVLHQICDWWNSIKSDPEHPFMPNGERNRLHYRYPFGMYHGLAAGFEGDFFDYITKGTKRGLVQSKLFRELSPS